MAKKAQKTPNKSPRKQVAPEPQDKADSKAAKSKPANRTGAASSKPAPAAKPASKATKSVIKPASKSAGKPAAKAPAKKSTSRPASKPAAAPKNSAKTTSAPAKKSSSRPVTKTVKRVNQPAKAAAKSNSATPAAPAKPAKSESPAPKPAAKAPSRASTPTASKSSAKKTAARNNATAAKSAAKAPVSERPAARTLLRPTTLSGRVPVSPFDLPAPEELRAIEEDDRELPLEYGDTKIVAMTRDPEWLFCYWEISAEDRRTRGLGDGATRRPLALRLHELTTGDEPGGTYSDVPVNDYTSSWYLRVPASGSRFRVQLGFYGDNGSFEAIATSNTITIPRRQITEETDVEFAEINDEIYDQIVQLSGGTQLRDRLGSDEFLRSLQQRVFQTLSEGPFSSGLSSASLFGISSGAPYGLSSALPSSWLLSSSSLIGGSSSFATPPSPEETVTHRRVDKDRGFWLEVGVDVIVYGATEPDAKVTFMGREIKLTPDGTFRFRMVLPDTQIDFPVVAESADAVEKRAVMPVVTRRTDGDPHKPL